MRWVGLARYRRKREVVFDGETFGQRRTLGDRTTAAASPQPRRSHNPGRNPLDDRKALSGILFVLKSGIPWEMLPQEMGCGSGMTCWRRLRDWQQAGVWQNLHETLLSRLHGADRLDLSLIHI